MQEEKQGAEREVEARALAMQQKADLEHLLKNTHPSLRNSLSLGDASNGTTQAIGDYAAITLRAELTALREEFAALQKDFDNLRSQVLKDWTPEIPASELPQLQFAPVLVPEPEPTLAAEELAPALSAEEESQLQVSEADAEHLRLNTKELPQ